MDQPRNAVVLGEAEYEIPGSAEFVGEGDLYRIPLTLLRRGIFKIGADLQLSQPRRLVVDDNDFEKTIPELAESIRQTGLDFPLIARWKPSEEENLLCEILDGDRRYHAIKFLIDTEAKCYCRITQDFRPAAEVYGTIPCRVHVIENDADAYKLMFNRQDTTQPWGDGAAVLFVKMCRESGITDEVILGCTGKNAKWLHDMDTLCNLDEYTFSFVAKNLIKLAEAHRLAKIKDVGARRIHLENAYGLAVKEHQEKVEKVDEALVTAEAKLELAEAEAEYARKRGLEATADVWDDKAAKAETKVKKKKKQREGLSNKEPRVGRRHIRKAVQQQQEAVESGEAEPTEAGEELLTSLPPGKIKKMLETVEEKIDAKDESLLPLITWKACQTLLKLILSGQDNLVEAFEKQQKLLNLMKKKKKEE